MKSPGSDRKIYVVIAALVVALDQLTKLLVDRFMSLHESHLLIDGVLRLTYVQNRGAAFGVLSDAQLPYQSILFSLISIAALGGICLLYTSPSPRDRQKSRMPSSA